mmetsp:Transcript_39950/g.97026  ORF Transcript_39950/g.97026 Transcript_39950/m.97026 type:complete len:233 (+) Transcript_39950:255-953(+)
MPSPRARDGGDRPHGVLHPRLHCGARRNACHFRVCPRRWAGDPEDARDGEAIQRAPAPQDGLLMGAPRGVHRAHHVWYRPGPRACCGRTREAHLNDSSRRDAQRSPYSAVQLGAGEVRKLPHLTPHRVSTERQAGLQRYKHRSARPRLRHRARRVFRGAAKKRGRRRLHPDRDHARASDLLGALRYRDMRVLLTRDATVGGGHRASARHRTSALRRVGRWPDRALQHAWEQD